MKKRKILGILLIVIPLEIIIITFVDFCSGELIDILYINIALILLLLIVSGTFLMKENKTKLNL